MEDSSPLATAANHAYSFWLFNGTAEGATKEMDAEIARMTKVGVPKAFVDAYAIECRAIIQRLAKGEKR